MVLFKQQRNLKEGKRKTSTAFNNDFRDFVILVTFGIIQSIFLLFVTAAYFFCSH